MYTYIYNMYIYIYTYNYNQLYTYIHPIMHSQKMPDLMGFGKILYSYLLMIFFSDSDAMISEDPAKGYRLESKV